MTQEEIQVLFKELCTRLPYKVKIHAKYIDADTGETEKDGVLSMVDNDLVIAFTSDDTNCYNYVTIHEIKPYLRPMSSMTEEERAERIGLLWELEGHIDEDVTYKYQDWLNKNHFDYRGLIPMGLAIAVTKENNPYG